MNEIISKLKAMKLSGMASCYDKQLANPNSDLKSFEERFTELVNEEYFLRYNKKLNRFLKHASLKYEDACIDDTINDANRELDVDTIKRLEKMEWLDEGRNVLITGLTGTGKTYLACAFAFLAIKEFKHVKYIRANTLLNELERARLQDEYLEYLEGLVDEDLLIIDDFGLMELDLDKCRDMFELIDTRDQKKSTIIVSQLSVPDWYDLFVNNTYADACLDRLIHKAYRLELKGKNMRNPD